MVLESYTSKAKNKPLNLFYLGFLYAAFSALLSLWVFRGYVSIVMVTFTAICSVPLVYDMITRESNVNFEPKQGFALLKQHSTAIKSFSYLFVGFVIAYLLWFAILPEDTSQEVFSAQLDTISHVTSTPSGNIYKFGTMGSILINNTKILVFCFLFSFFFGAGAIFIITWNATVVAAAIGSFVKNNIVGTLTNTVSTYSQLVSIGLLKYLTHGVLEIVAYFVVALAGGVFSTAILNYDYRTDEFKKLLVDSLNITSMSILILLFAAAVEVFVTPIIA